MSAEPTAVDLWEAMPIGQDLGSYDYHLTEAMIAGYRQSVGNPGAAYPTVAARHCLHLYNTFYPAGPRLLNAGHECEYYSPPEANATVTVTGKIADRYIKRGKRFVIVETYAHDASGNPIELSRIIGLVEGFKEVPANESKHSN